MEHQKQNSTSSKTSEATTSVIRLAINNAEKLFKDVDRQLNFPKIDNKPPLTLLAIDSPSSSSELNDSSDGMPQADTTKMIESDSSDCSRTVLVDTKTLNRQKELDERYGG